MMRIHTGYNINHKSCKYISRRYISNVLIMIDPMDVGEAHKEFMDTIIQPILNIKKFMKLLFFNRFLLHDYEEIIWDETIKQSYWSLLLQIGSESARIIYIKTLLLCMNIKLYMDNDKIASRIYIIYQCPNGRPYLNMHLSDKSEHIDIDINEILGLHK